MVSNFRRPERLDLKAKTVFGPYRGGIAVNVMEGQCYTPVRMITIGHREYQDADTLVGAHYTSAFYRVDDIPALILALQQAYEHCSLNPLTGDGSGDSNINGDNER